VIRWGLCCQFLDAPIRFRTATHRYVGTLAAATRRKYLVGIASDNAAALHAAVTQCRALGIGAFRINSQILPLGTHPLSGYSLERLDRSGAIREAFVAAGDAARRQDVRLSFHPDQFVVLNSERPEVVQSAVDELDFQAAIAELVRADTLVCHGGGMTGGTAAALERLQRGLDLLTDRARSRISLENDDRLFTPASLAPLCERAGVPLVYDVHHHRCNPDGLSVKEATALAVSTWRGREPWMHISSPRDGWSSANPRPHADYIDPADIPTEWRRLTMTVDVEAKAKERAVLAIMKATSRVRPPATARTGSRSRRAP
jgi:UV DNA damage endonuclease